MKKTMLLGAVLVAVVKIACGQEQTIHIGFQAPRLYNDGVDQPAVLTRPILITGYDISVSMLPSGPGVSEVLAYVGVSSGWYPQPMTPSQRHAYVGFGGNSDLTPMPMYGAVPGSGAIGGIGSGSGFLSSTILKSGNGSESSKESVRSGLNIYVPVGWYIIAHMDHAGTVVADAEMQGTISYIPQ